MMKTIIQGISLILFIPIIIIMMLLLTFSADADDVLIKYKKLSSFSTFEASMKSVHGLKLQKSFPDFGLYAFEIPEGVSLSSLLEELKKHPNIEYAEPNFVIETQSQGHFALDYKTEPLSSGVMDLSPLAGENPILVGVVDTGIDYTHPVLAPRIYQNPNEIAGNGKDDDGNGYIDDVRGWNFAEGTNDPMDDNNHGTHVAGIIAGVKGAGIIDLSGNFKLVPLKFLTAGGSGTTLDAISAISYGLSVGVKVFNNSWGGGGFSQALYDVITQTYEKGALFVAAAGNSSQDNDETPSYPASYNHPNILSVAAVSSFGLLAYFSNYGLTTVDVGAPGVSIYSTLPDNSYGTLSGTSMATPFVSRLAALMLDQNRNISVFQVKNVIQNTVLADSSLEEKSVSGGYINDAGAMAASKNLVADGVVPAFSPDTPAPSLPIFADLGESIDIGPTGCGTISTMGESKPFGDFFSFLSLLVMFVIIRLPGWGLNILTKNSF